MAGWRYAVELAMSVRIGRLTNISRSRRAGDATRPTGRFEFTFTPKHGSWLNLVEGFFSKFPRSVLPPHQGDLKI
jgi:hypothetical protein